MLQNDSYVRLFDDAVSIIKVEWDTKMILKVAIVAYFTVTQKSSLRYCKN